MDSGIANASTMATVTGRYRCYYCCCYYQILPTAGDHNDDDDDDDDILNFLFCFFCLFYLCTDFFYVLFLPREILYTDCVGMISFSSRTSDVGHSAALNFYILFCVVSFSFWFFWQLAMMMDFLH